MNQQNTYESAPPLPADYRLRSLSYVKNEAVTWLWKPYFPLRKISIVQGDPGEGKTSFVLMTLAKLSREGIVSIYVTAEDGIGDTIVPRLMRQNADLRMINTILTPAERPLTLTDPRLADAVMTVNAKVIVLDPIQAFLGASVNMNAANEIRPVMSQLGQLAETLDCAVILVGHQNKNAGLKDIYKGLGSIDITAAARSVITVSKIRSGQRSQRLVRQIKSSLAPEAPPCIYAFNESGALEYSGEYNSGQSTEKQSKLERCKLALYEYLKGQRRTAQEVQKYMEGRGFSKTTVERARAALRVQSKRLGKDFLLLLPQQEEEGGGQCPLPIRFAP
ncbi:MAG: AAA family ATPase [Oscillospiraceae bacterium]|nr:AAA family ATPase [Oscillospiraceae bacterium]